VHVFSTDSNIKLPFLSIIYLKRLLYRIQDELEMAMQVKWAKTGGR
jgi:hypothetical protein